MARRQSMARYLVSVGLLVHSLTDHVNAETHRFLRQSNEKQQQQGAEDLMSGHEAAEWFRDLMTEGEGALSYNYNEDYSIHPMMGASGFNTPAPSIPAVGVVDDIYRGAHDSGVHGAHDSGDAPEEEDEMCPGGIPGLQDEQACCPLECGVCGGEYCEENGVGAGVVCCSEVIVSSEIPCADTGVAPCILKKRGSSKKKDQSRKKYDTTVSTQEP